MKNTKIHEQMALFESENAQKFVFEYVQKGNFLCPEAQIKMLELPNAVDLLKEYLQHYSLSRNAQLKMMECVNVKDLLRVFAEKDLLCKSAQIKLFEHLDASSLVAIYISKQRLCEELQEKWQKMLKNN